MYEVKSGVDMNLAPPKPRKSKYPFGKMEVGDCFEVRVRNFDNCRVAAINYGKRHGKKYRTAKHENGKLMCWRVE